jgi:hypothetical protein
MFLSIPERAESYTKRFPVKRIARERMKNELPFELRLAGADFSISIAGRRHQKRRSPKGG